MLKEGVVWPQKDACCVRRSVGQRSHHPNYYARIIGTEKGKLRSNPKRKGKDGGKDYIRVSKEAGGRNGKLPAVFCLA